MFVDVPSPVPVRCNASLELSFINSLYDKHKTTLFIITYCTGSCPLFFLYNLSGCRHVANDVSTMAYTPWTLSVPCLFTLQFHSIRVSPEQDCLDTISPHVSAAFAVNQAIKPTR